MSLATMSKDSMQTEERDLRWLLDGKAEAPAVPIGGISADSRTLRAGEAFLACRGAGSHGLDYLGQALAAGAAAVVWGEGADAPGDTGVVTVSVPDLADRLGDIANRWFGAPSERLKVSGVTGTNGKTTVAFLIGQCMQLLGESCAYVGTLGAGIGSLDREPGLTTPGCIDLHRNLDDFVSGGAGFAAIEVSSHALAQQRTAGLRFDSALFTNLSRDHIDYHGDMAAYGEAKAGFLLQGRVKHRIVLTDSGFGAELAQRCGDELVAVSTNGDPGSPSKRQVHMHATVADQYGSAVEVRSSWGEAAFHLPLAGSFNVANAALVLAQLLCWDIPLARAVDVLARVLPPAGRMQRVPVDGDVPIVYIDYAHTPAGLESVLSTLRDHCSGRLWCVFGCGGDRDRGKRAMMGRVAAALADRPVLTSDNPRTESPAQIIADTLEGMDQGTAAIEDRAAAIAFAIANAADDDIVLIAGKGHEDYQLIGRERRPFSDYHVALANLERRAAEQRR